MALPPFSEEKPIYIVRPSFSRAIIPKIISFLTLGAIFYIGVLLNLMMLELSPSQEKMVKLSSVIILGVVIIVGIYLALRKALSQVSFYNNRVVRYKRSIDYLLITNTKPQRNLWDKIFRTYSIKLADKFYLRHIPLDISLENYLQQLVNYAQRNQRTN